MYMHIEILFATSMRAHECASSSNCEMYVQNVRRRNYVCLTKTTKIARNNNC